MKLCPKCNQRRSECKGGLCRRCISIKGQCQQCKKAKLIYINGYCYKCYTDQRIRERLSEVEKEFKPICEYNKYIFQLYMLYLKKYFLLDGHIKQCNQLKNMLESAPLNSFLSWMDIYKVSDEFKKTHGYNRRTGCPFIKIGTMLYELGVLGPRSDEKSHQINVIISSFNHPILEIVNDFFLMLQKTNRSQNTIMAYLRILRDAEKWLCEYKNCNLLTAHMDDISNYLKMLKDKKSANGYIINNYIHLNMFYKWGLQNKRLIHNPCSKISFNREQAKIIVCSEEQFRALFQFIKNSKSNPESAFLLALVLFWGFGSNDLRFARLESNNNCLKIILHRRLLTCGYKYYNRDQILQLPTEVPWFLDLQKRFYFFWSSRYTEIKKNYPNPLLVLPKSTKPISPIGAQAILDRIYMGTLAATGEKIPIRVLRQTCGYLYTAGNDASILNRLGWSQSFAFQYTWLPKVIFHQPDNEKNKRKIENGDYCI